MATPRKKRSSRKGPQQTNTYSSILGDHLRLINQANSNTKETRSNNRYVLTGGRRSSDRDVSEILSMWKSLSAREKEVTVLVCEGLTNEQIAHLLEISVASVKTYLRFVFSKTGVRNKIDLRLKFYNFDFQRNTSHYI